MIKGYARRDERSPLSGVAAQTARRAADALTNLAHENGSIKDRVRAEGGVPPLVSLLHSADCKIQRAAAGSLRTLAFKNDENKACIVELGALPLLVQMLRAEDSSVHYEAVGVIGNLVHSSAAIKRRVLEEGALQAVVNLLSSPCPDSQREAALLLGQFATAEGDYKQRIAQRGAVQPLVEMLGAADVQLREMAAFALGRLAQNADNQAGIVAAGGLPPLLDLLESRVGNLQHNAAFALYGLSDNEDNLVEFVRDGAVQRIAACDLIVQASRDCVTKTLKRLQERLQGRVLGQILYVASTASSIAVRRRIAVALCLLASEDRPAAHLPFVRRGCLDVLLDLLCDPATPGDQQAAAAAAVARLAQAAGAKPDASGLGADASDPSAAVVGPSPPGDRPVYLGARYVNDPTMADVVFNVQGRSFYAHKIALLASSDVFRSMFEGRYRERDAETVDIPNIRWEAFEAMMRCIYTGTLDVPPELAQELLEAADQYMLDDLKRLCEKALAAQLSPETVAAAYELSENYAAADLAKSCVLYVLEHYREMLAAPRAKTAAYAVILQRMRTRLRAAIADAAEKKAAAEGGAGIVQRPRV